ncbi:MAG: 50S ribosomal protein L9 [Bacteroidales bacterium]|nr:50S ribosomal protein L9 [Bacteroidales bacterium]
MKQDIKNLGNADDIVKVKNGYAVNYLIPKGMAIMVTPSVKKQHEETVRQRAHKEEKFRADAEALKAKLEAAVVKITAKVSSKGKVYGSVTNMMVADELVKQGFSVDKRNVEFEGVDTIKAVGAYTAEIKCYKDIKAKLNFEVVSDGETPAETTEEKAEA